MILINDFAKWARDNAEKINAIEHPCSNDDFFAISIASVCADCDDVENPTRALIEFQRKVEAAK